MFLLSQDAGIKRGVGSQDACSKEVLNAYASTAAIIMAGKPHAATALTSLHHDASKTVMKGLQV